MEGNENNNQGIPKIKLKSEMYHHDSEKIEKRENTDANNAMMWGFVIGFALFLVILIMIVIFVH